MSELDASSVGTAPALPPKRPQTRLIAIIVASALVLVGVGAWAVYATVLGSDGGAADSAKALPASTIMMFEFSIEPSTQQKVFFAKMGNQLDGLQEYLDSTNTDISLDEEHSTELRPAIWNAIVDGLDIDTQLDYDKDLAPWLGGRIAIGIVGGTDDPAESWIIAIESRNDEAGVDATKTFIDDAFDHEARDVQVEARDGYIIVAPDALDLDEAYQDGVLADQPAFKGVINRLGSRGLASFWMGEYATTEAIAGWSREYDRDTYRLLSDALDDIPLTASQAMVIRAFDGGLEILGASSGAPTSPSLRSGGDAGKQIGSLPDTTAMAVSLQQIGGLLDTALTREYLATSGLLLSAGTMGVAPYLAEGGMSEYDDRVTYEDIVSAWTDDLRGSIEDAFGLDIPDEFDVAFGSGMVVAVDRELNCAVDDVSCDEPRVALVIHTRDIDETSNAMDDLLKDAGIKSSDLDYTVSDDESRLVLGVGDYVDELTIDAPNSLADLPEFRRALPDAGSATVAMYLSVDGLLSIASDNGAELDSDVENSIRDFAAVGLTATILPDGTILSRYRIVLAD